MKRIFFALCTLFFLTAGCAPQFATSQDGSKLWPEAQAVYRKFVPRLDDAELSAKIADPRTLFYSDREMPRVFQSAAMGNGPQVSVHDVRDSIAANPDPHAAALGLDPHVGNGNREFPWAKPAGLDHVKNAVQVRFVSLPAGKPVVWWTAQTPGNQYQIMHWTYPVGTVVGEVLSLRGPDGFDYPFEVRTRTREPQLWLTSVYRPFRTTAELKAAIERLRPNVAPRTPLANLLEHLGARIKLARYRFADGQPLKRVIDQPAASAEPLPAAGDDLLVKQLLTRSVFRDASAEAGWATEGGETAFAATTKAPFHIVPAGYTAEAIEVSVESCQRCHQTAGHHVEQFAANGTGGGRREWYGTISGSDGIFSFAPLAKGSASPSNLGSLIRRDLAAAGIVAQHQPAKHAAADYVRIRDYDPAFAPRIDVGFKTGGGGY